MTKHRILVCVHDIDHVLTAIDMAFAANEYSVTIASNVDSALSRLSQAQFDLMITDLVMITEEAFSALPEAGEWNSTTKLMVLSGEGELLFVVDSMKNIQVGLDIASF